jgi:hypothetical protein
MRKRYAASRRDLLVHEPEAFGTPGAPPRGDDVETTPEPFAVRLRRTLRIPYRRQHLVVPVHIRRWTGSVQEDSGGKRDGAEPYRLEQAKVPTVPDSPTARRASELARSSSLDPLSVTTSDRRVSTLTYRVWGAMIAAFSCASLVVILAKTWVREDEPAHDPTTTRSAAESIPKAGTEAEQRRKPAGLAPDTHTTPQAPPALAPSERNDVLTVEVNAGARGKKNAAKATRPVAGQDDAGVSTQADQRDMIPEADSPRDSRALLKDMPVLE